MRATAKQYADAWYEKLSEAEEKDWNGISESMLTLIHRAGEMRVLPEVLRLVEKRQLTEEGVTPVTVRSAHEVDEKVITEQLKKVLPDATVKITNEIDESIIGGVQIETENQRWDFSLRGQLRALSKTIND